MSKVLFFVLYYIPIPKYMVEERDHEPEGTDGAKPNEGIKGGSVVWGVGVVEGEGQEEGEEGEEEGTSEVHYREGREGALIVSIFSFFHIN